MAKSEKTKVSKKPVSDATSIVMQNLYVSQLTRGNQTIQTWINNVKSAESVTNPNRKALLSTYHDAAIDLHLKSLMDKRVRAVKTVPFEWDNLTDDRIIENFRSPWFFKMQGILMSRIFYGHTLAEFGLGDDGLIGSVKMIPRQNVKPEKKLISFDGNSDNGARFDEPPYINYILEIGEEEDLGLLAHIVPYVLLKRGNLSDYSLFNQMFGIPLRWYEYDPLDPTARDNVKKAAEEMGAAAYVIVPKGTTVNFVESAKQATAYTFEKFHSIMNDEMTIGVLGQLLTTGGQNGGSYALGMVHQAVETGINLEDRLGCEYIINYPFKNNILVPHGYPIADLKGRYKVSEEIPKDKKAEIWLKLSEGGLPIAEEDYYNEFGIPFPDGRPVVVPPQPAVAEDEDVEPGGAAGKKGKAPAKKPGAKLAAISEAVSLLYQSQCKHRHKHNEIALSYTDDLTALIEQIIRDLYSGKLKAGDVSQELVDLIGGQLFEAVEAGFGTSLAMASGTDEAMLIELRKNIYVFSGFKNYQMLREASALLVDSTGKVKSFTDFRNDVLQLNETYNLSFLKAEYNHAIGTARMASKWAKATKDQAALPLLQYITAGDARVRESHRPLNGMILPVDHPFWDEYYPPNDWNCRCNVKQLAEGTQSVVKSEDLPQIRDEFKFNPGKQKVIFPKSHPYYKVQASHQDNAENNFGLKLP